MTIQVHSPSVPKHPAVLAGVAKPRTIHVWNCRCVKCGHAWTTSGPELPVWCPGCGKDNWWLKRPVGRPRKEP